MVPDLKMVVEAFVLLEWKLHYLPKLFPTDLEECKFIDAVMHEDSLQGGIEMGTEDFEGTARDIVVVIQGKEETNLKLVDIMILGIKANFLGTMVEGGKRDMLVDLRDKEDINFAKDILLIEDTKELTPLNCIDLEVVKI